jgi:hypothetical protein
MTCRERQDDLLLYALDALDGAERDSLEEHLGSGCPGCAGGLAEARATAAHLAYAATPIAPRPEVKERLLRRMKATARATPAAPRRPARTWLAPALAAAAAAAATFLLVGLPLKREHAALRADLARSEARARDAEALYDQAARTLRLLRAPGLEMAALAGQKPSPGARGMTLRDPASGAWQLLVSELPPSAPGRTYEVWLIAADGRALPAGTFDVDAAGEAEVRLTPPTGVAVTHVAITDEPDGGVPAPTGDIHLLGPAGS